ncbi:MAG: tetrahydromethanopterin S-methyltransferase subunit A [Nitrosopumilus sp. H8]|nr:MAG: tetrahydromethanopterin S-methyltransferase subunit A [Nitrosopumilus sp. H8]
MNALGEALGEICAAVLPVPEKLYHGNQGSHVAVCTLSSMKLLGMIGCSKIMDNVCVAGRLLSENKGIDSIIEYVSTGRINTIVVCGMDVMGHRAGHSLFKLYKNGTDEDGRIAGSESPDPYLASPAHKIDYFRSNVTLVDMMGETDLGKIHKVSSRLSASCS